MADEILNARVKQKVDTEENWLANTLILLEGEQGFVVDELGDPVNFKIGDGTKTFAELPYWINYMSNVISHKIITFTNVSAPVEILSVFKDRTNLYDIVITNIGGAAFVLNIGTTEGGSEIGTYTIPAGNTVIDLKEAFQVPTDIYFSGYTGNAVSIIVVYFNYAENPIAPPSGPDTPAAFRFPKGFQGMFVPIGTGHLEACFDMITGDGVVGSAYENCKLCQGDNAYSNMEDSYPVGYKTGMTIGGLLGNAANTVAIAQANIPVYNLEFSYNFINQQRGSSGSRYDFTTEIPGGNRTVFIPSRGSGVPLNIRPRSRVTLYFVAVTD